jgi:hypothetical protein
MLTIQGKMDHLPMDLRTNFNREEVGLSTPDVKRIEDMDENTIG